MDKNNKAEILQSLNAEKNMLCTIRSLSTDDRFIRFVGAMRTRQEVTVSQFDSLEADDTLKISELKGVRKVYAYELGMIDSADARIKEIDEILSTINKRASKNNGNAGSHGAIPPKEIR